MKTRATLYKDRLVVGYCGYEGAKPPNNEGRRLTYAISSKARTRIKRAGDYLASKGAVKMITLTYDTEVCHSYAKKHLGRFLKRMVRFGVTHYVWVAEIQPKRYAKTGERVIHFHILWNNYIRIESIRDAWNETRGDYYPVNNTLRVHVTEVRTAGKYLAKVGEYLAKDEEMEEWQGIEGNRYFISRALGAELKPLSVSVIDEVVDWSKLVPRNDLRKSWFSTDNFLLVSWGFSAYSLYSSNERKLR